MDNENLLNFVKSCLKEKGFIISDREDGFNCDKRLYYYSYDYVCIEYCEGYFRFRIKVAGEIVFISGTFTIKGLLLNLNKILEFTRTYIAYYFQRTGGKDE